MSPSFSGHSRNTINGTTLNDWHGFWGTQHPNWSQLDSTPRSTFEPESVSSPKQLLCPLLCLSKQGDAPRCFFFKLQTSSELLALGKAHLGWERHPDRWALPAAAQGTVAARVTEINCLASAGETLEEQMAQSFFSLLLLPSEWEKSECSRG